MATFYDEHDHASAGGGSEAPARAPASPGKRTLTAGIFAARRESAPAMPPTFGKPSTEEMAYFFAATPTEGGADGAPASPTAAGHAGGGALLVEDDAEAGPNQMRKSAFLAEAAALMPGEDVGPWRERPSGEIESTVRRQIPGAANATSARAFLSAIRAQQQTASQGAAAPAFAAMSDDAMRDHLRGGGLGAGSALPSSTRAAMEAAYRQDFADVRVYTDDAAAQYAAALGARAVTVGHHIAFAAGSFAPGSALGDALLAHELAHVVQQRGGSTSSGGNEAGSHEADADQAAAYAMSSIYGGDMASGAPAVPALRADVGIQRCPSGGGGGGGGGALTFASSAFSPGGGGPVTATAASAQLTLQSAAYASSGSATVAGGTDADAQGWDIGYLQTVAATRRTGHYTGTSANTKFEVTMPANTRDGNPAGTAPWYDSANPSAFHAVSKTATTETASLWDRPGMGFAWDTPDGKSKLDHVDGKDQFATWIVVRKRAAPNTIQYLNWESWEVNWAATTTYASAGTKTATPTGQTALTGSGAGQGASSPNLTGGVANNVATAGWS